MSDTAQSTTTNQSGNRWQPHVRPQRRKTFLISVFRKFALSYRHAWLATWVSGLLVLGALWVGGASWLTAAQEGAGRANPLPSFDMREVSRYRPVFNTTYFGGFKGTTDDHYGGKNISTQVEGIADMSQDFQRIKYYLDPFMTHALFGFRAWPRFEWPDLVKNDPAEIERWKREAGNQLSQLFKTYRENQFQLIISDGFFVNTGANTGSEWYEKVPNWSELTLEGKVPEVTTEDARRRSQGIACLAHPELYRIQEGFAALRKELGLDKEKVIVGFEPENEPGIELRDFGGNPYTRALFREYLKKEDGDIAGFNHLVGTHYKSFDEVDMAYPSPIMRAWADRFRAWLVSDYYQGKLNDINRRYFPHWELSTRFQTFDFTGPRGDISYLQEITTDYAGISYYPNAYINKEGQAVRNRMGMLAGLGSMLSAFGRPVALTEFGIAKGIAPSTVLTESFRPYEVTNLLYRSLAYNVRFIEVFWYEPPVPDSWANVYGMNLSRFPETLLAFRQVRDELERIRPYQSFGKVYQNELAVLVSRNAIHYPGAGSLYYGALQKRLWEIMDEPELSQYDLVEEHTRGLEGRLSGYRGVVVIDACLQRETREILERLARRGVRILVLGVPQYLDERFRPAEPPTSYPVASVKGGAVALNADRKPAGAVGEQHPVLGGRRQWTLVQAASVEPRSGASVLLRQAESQQVLGYANERAAYISGLPAGREELRDLLLGFTRWTGAAVRPLVVNQYENAMVVQNYCPEAENLREQTLSEKIWIGSLAMRDGSWKGQLREMRQDMPWLAYTRTGERIQVEGLRLDTMEVQVIQKREGKELPHFEETPDDMGFLEFMLGWDHLVGKFEVSKGDEKVLRFAAGMWTQTPVHWQINEVNSPEIVAEGSPPEIRFRAQPGKRYYLIVRLTEPHSPKCPLCSQGRMM